MRTLNGRRGLSWAAWVALAGLATACTASPGGEGRTRADAAIDGVPESEVESEVETESEVEVETESESEIETETETETESESEVETESEVASDSEVASEVASETQVEPETEVEPESPPTDPLAFAPPVLVASTPGNSKVPVVAYADGLHVVWHDFTTNPPGLYHAWREPGATAFQAAPLALVPGRAVFPDLLADGPALELVFEADDDSGAHVVHATWRQGAWTAPEIVMAGAHPHLARDGHGRLHVVAFDAAVPVHAVRTDAGWAATASIAIADPYVDALDLAVAPTTDGVEVGLATSPGETSYDIRRWAWTPAGWGPMQTVFASLNLSSDDLDVAARADGLVWVWTEQSTVDPWTIPVVALAPGDARPELVTHEAGFALSPSVVVPPDGHAIVAWVTPRDTIALGRAPFARDVEIGGSGAAAPRMTVAPSGVTTLVFVGRDAAGVQQIWLTDNRAN